MLNYFKHRCSPPVYLPPDLLQLKFSDHRRHSLLTQTFQQDYKDAFLAPTSPSLTSLKPANDRASSSELGQPCFSHEMLKQCTLPDRMACLSHYLLNKHNLMS